MKTIPFYQALLIASLCIFTNELAAQITPKSQADIEKILREQPQDTAKNQAKVHLSMFAKSYGDSVVLRWSFDNADAWRYLLEKGFILERLTLDDATNAQQTEFVAIKKDPIRPMPKAQWQPFLDRRDTFPTIAAAYLFEPDTSKFRGTDAKSYLAFIRQKQDAERNRFFVLSLISAMSPTAATGLGLRFTDRQAEKDKKYFYRLRVENPSNSFWAIDTALCLVRPADVSPIFQPAAPELTARDSLIGLRWDKSKEFFAWHIWKSTDNIQFKRLTQTPYFQVYTGLEGDPNSVVFSDTLSKNYQDCFYKIQGINAFGETSPFSETVKAHGIDLTPTVKPYLFAASNTEAKIVQLQWLVEPAADLTKLLVLRSQTDIVGPYDTLAKLDKAITQFTDLNADEFGINFYRIVSVDEHDNLNFSNALYAYMANRLPPQSPVGLQGEIDTNGVVILFWKPNADRDLMGYNVYAANNPDHEFVPVSKLVLDTVFLDTIRLRTTLDEKIFYKIVAVDNGYKISEFSEVFSLVKPDLVPPVAPLLSDYWVSDSSIFLSWQPSGSADVQKHRLFRSVNDQKMELLAEFADSTQTYTDRKVSHKNKYEYSLDAVDDAGNASEKCAPFRLRPFDSGKRPEVLNLKIKYLKDSKMVALDWDYPPDWTPSVRFMIWRASDEKDLRKYQIGSEGALRFQDSGIAQGKIYRYAVQAVSNDGGASLLSKPVVVQVE